MASVSSLVLFDLFPPDTGLTLDTSVVVKELTESGNANKSGVKLGDQLQQVCVCLSVVAVHVHVHVAACTCTCQVALVPTTDTCRCIIIIVIVRICLIVICTCRLTVSRCPQTRTTLSDSPRNCWTPPHRLSPSPYCDRLPQCPQVIAGDFPSHRVWPTLPSAHCRGPYPCPSTHWSTRSTEGYSIGRFRRTVTCPCLCQSPGLLTTNTLQ